MKEQLRTGNLRAPTRGGARQQALKQGRLIDVSFDGTRAGLRPVAVTKAVWDACIAVPPGANIGDDERERLWNLLWMLAVVARDKGHRPLLSFTLAVENGHEKPVPVRLMATCTPGDDLRPVITVMVVGEEAIQPQR